MAACPDCGSENKFPRRRRQLDGDHVEIYVACRLCPWEQVIHSGPREVVEVAIDIEKLEGRVRAGATSLQQVLDRRRRRLAELRREHGLDAG